MFISDICTTQLLSAFNITYVIIIYIYYISTIYFENSCNRCCRCCQPLVVLIQTNFFRGWEARLMMYSRLRQIQNPNVPVHCHWLKSHMLLFKSQKIETNLYEMLSIITIKTIL